MYPLFFASILLTLHHIPFAYSSVQDKICPVNQDCNHAGDADVIKGVDEPYLFEKSYVVGDDNFTRLTYIMPDVSTFYNEEPGSRKLRKPRFDGFAAKFINMSPDRVQMYWYSPNSKQGIFFNILDPFCSTGTATYPSHQFYFTPEEDGNTALQWFTMNPGKSLYVYNPLEGYKEDELPLNDEQLSLYKIQKENLEFAKQYRKYTGIDWLSLYPRQRPRHHIWRADYFGQQHSIETRETHFITSPPASELGRIRETGVDRRLDYKSQPKPLNAYRDPNDTLNLTLTVLSCAPRVFEINNFLSEVEIDHILYLAAGIELGESRTGTHGGKHSYDKNTKTRTSKNSWVDREMSPIVDTIYRRAADVLRIDEALLRDRSPEEIPHWPNTNTAGENLQLVHYDVAQEYTAHHDFKYPHPTDTMQRTRFATILLYLNEGMKGGETAFPRWMNAETNRDLKVSPKRTKAVLFYSYLPDGNTDDLSQHAALPVQQGEKWLLNLWVWDPSFY